MSDLIDKIARDRAVKITPRIADTVRAEGGSGIHDMLAQEIASAMREAVRLSGGTVPTLESESK